jgi:hypothetical protein
MSFNFLDLSSETRELMIEELQYDLQNDSLYLSSRLSANGKAMYVDLLSEAMKNGNTQTLGDSLLRNNCLNSSVARRTKNGTTLTKMPSNAHTILAEGEFNRFYIRSLCKRSLNYKAGDLEVYRAKEVNQPRPESDRLIGKRMNAAHLLDDLRSNQGLDTALGLPPGANSGLSVKLV